MMPILRTRAGLIGLACAVAGLVYANSLVNGFALDDVHIIEHNARVRDLFNLRAIWATPYWPESGKALGLYRPLAIFLYASQWLYGGGAPWIFHLVNILLHVTATGLAFLLLERLVDTRAAFVGALLFAVHPVHTEAVANVVGQAELIAAAVMLAACVVHSARPPGEAIAWPRRGVLLLCFTIGLLVKENAVVLPALLVACDFGQRRIRMTTRGWADYAKAVLVPFLLLACVLTVYLAVRMQVLGGTVTGSEAGPLARLSGGERVLHALRAFPEFLRLLFYPADLSADYSPGVILPVHSVTPMVVTGALLLAAISLLALLTPRIPAAGFAAAWFLVSIITVSNLFFSIGVLIAERTLYLPSFAVCALAAYAWRHFAPLASVPVRRAALAIVATIVVVFGARTVLRNRDWKSTEAVQSALVRDHPECYRAQWVLAANAAAAGDDDRAIAHYELGCRIYPLDSQFLTEFGNFLLSRGRFAPAVDMLQRAADLTGHSPRTTAFLAYAYLLADRPREAIAMADRAESMGAFVAGMTLPIRAGAWSALGERDKALGEWRTLLTLPGMNSWRNQMFLARELAIAGRPQEALAAVASAHFLKPPVGAAAVEDRFTLAVKSGCYEAISPGSRMPDCDPLGDYLGYVRAKR